MNLNSRSAYINTESISSDMRPSTPVTSSNLSSSDASSLSGTSFRIGTLNCRSLRPKLTDPTTNAEFIRYLRTKNFDILALQETHAKTPELESLFHTQFQASDSIWSPHCGIVSFSPDLSFSNTHYSDCGRVITTTVSHSSELFESITVTVVYAPANPQERFTFLKDIMLNLNESPLLSINPSRHILLGDLNYSPPLRGRRTQAPKVWLDYLAGSFINGVTPNNESAPITFIRGNQRSSIDYIFLSQDLSLFRTTSQVTYITPAWTDHLLVQVRLHLLPKITVDSTKKVGKGLWRAHPKLASDPAFCYRLHVALSRTIAGFVPGYPTTLKWEDLKATTKYTAQSYSRKKAYTLARAEKLLHLKHKGLLSQLTCSPDRIKDIQPLLQVVEEQLASIQQYHAETLALRAGLRWRELGEISAGYLKRTVQQRSIHHLIPPLIHPQTGALSTSKEDMLDAASTFYSKLYSPDDIDQSAIDDLLENIPDSLCLSSEDQTFLKAPITFDDLLEGVARCPSKSSPGEDGLPYEILQLIINHPNCREITLAVFNDALAYGIFPPSWQVTCVSLLPKKGTLSDLRNYRPISLINTDAKVFTRILNTRVTSCVESLINPYQTGFVRGRFIADNGLLMKLVMEHARNTRSSAIGLLLDQEKAYDRVHPKYLEQVLLRFGFPSTLVDSLLGLFFGTSLRLNVNGFLSDPVPQLRGLRQGDPISPVLFNLAFEPFLRGILADPSFSGFSLPSAPRYPLVNTPDPPEDVKLLAYADDVICLLNDPLDLEVLQSHLHRYSRASNAQVNLHKTQALSLSGKPILNSSLWSSPLLSHSIDQWHDCTAAGPLTYLGFPLYSSTKQRDSYLNALLDKIRDACNIHSQRSLSIRGRVTILNTLILSKLWHVIRVTSVPLSFFSKLKSIMSSFLSYRMFPRIGIASMCQPRSKGGLGVLDPQIQQGALQLRWILPLLQLSLSGEFASSNWSCPAIANSIILPRITQFLIHHLSNDGSFDSLDWSKFDSRLAFVFSDLRPPRLRDPQSSLSLLFSAVDRIPHHFQHVVVSAHTCLSLPLSAVCLDNPQVNLSRTLKNLRCSEVYIFDIDKLSLRHKRPSEITVHPQLAKRFLELIRSNQLALHPFFARAFIPPVYAPIGPHPFLSVLHSRIDATPLLSALSLIDPPTSRGLTSRAYRALCLPPSPKRHPHLVSSAWSRFWHLPLVSTCRNVWYRLLHRMLPYRSLLHRISPSYFVSASCPICLESEDTFDHFLFACPMKLEVWATCWYQYFGTPFFSLNNIAAALLRLEFPPLLPHVVQLDPGAIIGACLLGIWRCHWSLIYSDVPFLPLSAFSQVSSLISRSSQEHLIQQGLSPLPLPHFHI
jgi:endonuclease/exonuclease/phosphatase family metal-dependent hydrolase